LQRSLLDPGQQQLDPPALFQDNSRRQGGTQC
jgi:hypothetical protein